MEAAADIPRDNVAAANLPVVSYAERRPQIKATSAESASARCLFADLFIDPLVRAFICL